MAKITPGIGFSSAAGSVAGVTYTRSGSGLVMRDRKLRAFARGSIAMTTRRRFSAVTQMWRDLTDAQRANWHRWAESLPTEDSSLHGAANSGFTCFVNANLNQLEFGQAILTNPGGLQVRPRVTLIPTTIDLATAQLSFSFTRTTAGSGTNAVYMTRPLSPGIYNPAGQSFHLIRMPATNTVLNYIGNYTTAWFQLTTEHIGQVIFIKALVKGTDGLKSPAQLIRLVLT